MNAAMPTRIKSRRRALAWLVVAGVTYLAGCGSLLPAVPAPPTVYLLEGGSPRLVDSPSPPGLANATATLVVADPRAAPGYGTRRIAYVRTANQIEYFAFSQWAEPPAAMLAPLLVHAIDRSGAYRSVVRAPVPVAGDLRLDTELIRLHQDFSVSPSVVRLTLRAVLIDIATRRVLATREFDAEVPSASEDPAGGVMAANQAARRLAAEVGAFCAERIGQRK